TAISPSVDKKTSLWIVSVLNFDEERLLDNFGEVKSWDFGYDWNLGL
ncbi:35841_t:CDS:2, partial [Gigaspora margarita]